MKYEPLSFKSREETLAAIATGDATEVTESILGAALYSEESLWVEACAIALTLASEPGVRRAGVLAIGHLIRRFPSLDSAVVDIVVRRMWDENETHLGAVEDLKSDREMFRRE